MWIKSTKWWRNGRTCVKKNVLFLKVVFFGDFLVSWSNQIKGQLLKFFFEWRVSGSNCLLPPQIRLFVCDFPCKPTDAVLTAERVHSVVNCRGTRLTYWQPWGIHMMLRRVGPAAVPDKQPARWWEIRLVFASWNDCLIRLQPAQTGVMQLMDFCGDL